MEKEFEINRIKVRAYDLTIAIAGLLLFSICPLTLGSIILTRPDWESIIFLGFLWFGGISLTASYILLIPLRTKALLYRVDGRTLRVHKGIFFKSRKSIPLEKITDIELVQHPILWLLQMWNLRIQTASTGTQTPEATLIGCVNPEQVRDDILTARDEYMKGLASR